MIRILLVILLSNLLWNTVFAQDDEPPVLWTTRWSNDGQWIAVGGDDSILRIYDTKNFQLHEEFAFEGSILRMEWHPTKSKLAVGATHTASCIIDLDFRTRKALAGSTIGYRGIAWNSDGKYLAGSGLNAKVVIWDELGEIIQSISKEDTYSYVGIDWHPKRDEVIVLGDVIRLYNMKGELIDRLRHRSERVLMLSVQWHPSGKFYALGDYGIPEYNYSPILQFRNQKNEQIFSNEICSAEIRNIRWNKKGSRLAVASDKLRIFSKKGKLLYTGNIAETDKLWGIDWSPDGKYIITSSQDRKAVIWNKKAEQVRILEER